MGLAEPQEPRYCLSHGASQLHHCSTVVCQVPYSRTLRFRYAIWSGADLRELLWKTPQQATTAHCHRAIEPDTRKVMPHYQHPKPGCTRRLCDCLHYTWYAGGQRQGTPTKSCHSSATVTSPATTRGGTLALPTRLKVSGVA